MAAAWPRLSSPSRLHGGGAGNDFPAPGIQLQLLPLAALAPVVWASCPLPAACCGAQPFSLCSVTLSSPRFPVLLTPPQPVTSHPSPVQLLPCAWLLLNLQLSGVVASIEKSSMSAGPSLEQTPDANPSLYEPLALPFIPLRVLRIMSLNDCVTLSHQTVGFMRIGAMFIPCKAQKRQL